MKRLIGTIFVLVSLPLLGLAQSNDYSKGHGYGYFALGASSADGTKTTHIGGGGEGFFTRNLGLGAEAGYLAPFGGFSSDGIGTISPNFIARFRAQRHENKVEPLLTVGYTLFVAEGGSESGANFGAGVNYWFKARIGLRFELRDSVMIPGGDVTATHFVGIRMGMTFR